jgi:hypothetical protein
MEDDSGAITADTNLARAAKSTVGVHALVEPALVDLKGAQAFLSLSGPSVRAEMAAGRLHAKTFGRKPLFELSELRRYAASLPAWEPK